MASERTLIIVKPDGVQRGLIGEVISRLEAAGLAITHLSVVTPSEDIIEAHYQDDPAWLDNAGQRAIDAMVAGGLDWIELTGASNAAEVGRVIRQRLVRYMTSGPVAVVVCRGPQAVRKGRQIVGSTLPLEAAPGSIRGTYCTDDVVPSFEARRALENAVHASGSIDEAEVEIALWT